MNIIKSSKNSGSLHTSLQRGDVYIINLEPIQGSEMGKTRPCVIIQNDIGNKFSPTIIVAPISSHKEVTKPLPIMTFVSQGDGGLEEDSYVDAGQIRTVARERFSRKVGQFSALTMKAVDKSIKISLELK